jgi:hypothetical protein
MTETTENVAVSAAAVMQEQLDMPIPPEGWELVQALEANGMVITWARPSQPPPLYDQEAENVWGDLDEDEEPEPAEHEAEEPKEQNE